MHRKTNKSSTHVRITPGAAKSVKCGSFEPKMGSLNWMGTLPRLGLWSQAFRISPIKSKYENCRSRNSNVSICMSVNGRRGNRIRGLSDG